MKKLKNWASILIVKSLFSFLHISALFLALGLVQNTNKLLHMAIVDLN